MEVFMNRKNMHVNKLWKSLCMHIFLIDKDFHVAKMSYLLYAELFDCLCNLSADFFTFIGETCSLFLYLFLWHLYFDIFLFHVM